MNNETQTAELLRTIRPMIEQVIYQGLQRFLGEKPAENSHNLIYGLKGLAEFLGVTKATAIRIAKSGRFPYYRIGQTRIFKADEVLSAMRVEPGEQSKYGTNLLETKNTL